jgi:hypothetical protein
MRTFGISLALMLSAACISQGQERASTSITAEDRDFFEKKVRPLLVERCYKCHSGQARKVQGGLRLDSREGLLRGGDSGPAIVPGQPDKSLLLRAISYRDENLLMPPSGRLPAQEVSVLEDWVERGAPYPGPAGTALTPAAVDLVKGRQFWSFQPPRMAEFPVIRQQDRVRQRLDAFVLAELEKQGLDPSPLADRRTLIRRAFFDLIGLPPSAEEVEAFVEDPAPDAYPRLIDRLLASPQYGERWGRYWLDLARYCDIAESWADSKGQPWLYRDWVVRSFNEDLPYDQFVMKQLAADLMPDADPGDRAALGFLGLSPNYWKELKLDKEVIKAVVAEEWEERIQTVTGTFLGLTVACARCHDHKFDPITTQDYYALAGVFASIRQADLTLLPKAEAETVHSARQTAQARQDALKKLQAQKPVTPELTKQIADLQAKIEEIRRTTPHFDAPLVPGVAESSLHVLPDGPHRTRLEYRAGVAQDVAVQIRGSPTNLGPVVPRRFLTVLASESSKPFTQGSGRLDLAHALVTEGAPLTARVIVNRIWKLHFGTGLVETTSDFGTQGDRPSHPALLDDLAARFLQNGWSIKWLHREIMLSATYQQRSAAGGRQAVADPGNRWLWRMNHRRLEVEAWRDAMLAVSGTLSQEVGGPPLDLGDLKNQRRTLYGTVKRRELNDLLRLHDFPDPTTHSPGRLPTTTPLQQLFVLNSPFLQQQASALAQRLKKEAANGNEARITRAYQLLYQRPATATEARIALEFLSAAKPGSPESEALWQQYAQVLLGSNEFLFID